MESSWTWGWAIRNIIAELLMPPTIWIILGLLFLIFLRNKRKIQSLMIGFMFALIWITSTEFFSQNLYQFTDLWMHWPKPFDFASLNTPQNKEDLGQSFNQDKINKRTNQAQNNSQLNEVFDNRKINKINKPEITPQLNLNNMAFDPQGIVILGGGVRSGAIELPQYQNQDVSKEQKKQTIALRSKLLKESK